MDTGLVTVLVAVVGVVPPVVTLFVAYFQARSTAKVAALVAQESTKRAEESTAVVQRLDTIHTLVNSQLTEAVERFKQAQITVTELKAVIDKISKDKK